MIYPPPAPWKEKTIVPSKGAVRAVYYKGRVIGYQDPDIVMQRTYPDGRITTYRNPFIGREFAVDRLHWDFKVGKVLDSFNNRVGVGNLMLPSSGRVVDYKTMQARWFPLKIDPRRFRPAPNQEVIERVIFVDREGRLRLTRTSYGLGRRYDRSRYGGRWRSWASRALGLPPEDRVSTAQLQKAVLHREFIIKTLVPKGG